jgi:hypothetical protein
LLSSKVFVIFSLKIPHSIFFAESRLGTFKLRQYAFPVEEAMNPKVTTRGVIGWDLRTIEFLGEKCSAKKALMC